MPKKPDSRIAKFLIWRYKHTSKKQFINILSAIIGLLAGIAAVVLKNLTHLIQSLLDGKYIGSYHQLFYFIFPLIGFFFVTLIIKYVIKKQVGHGIPSTLYAISKLKSILPQHQMWASIVTAPLTVGFGGSVGLEGPTVATGAGIGSNIAQFFHLNQTSRNLLVGAAAAAAMSSIFKAPIAGIVFAVEIFSLDLTLFSMVPLLIASITAILTSFFFFGEDVLLHFPADATFNVHNTIFYALFGVGAAAVSIYFNKTYFAISHFFEKIANRYKRLVLGGLLIGIMVYLVPPLFGEGYETINLILRGQVEKVISYNFLDLAPDSALVIIGFLLVLVAFKVVAMSITFGAGGVGGVFAPTLFTGSVFGYVFAYGVNASNLFNNQLSTSNFALVGMAGLISGVLQAPLTAIFLIAEITNGYDLFVPLMITASISFLVVRHYLPHNIYATELAEKGQLLTHDKDKTVLSLMEFNKIIEKNFIAVTPDMKLGKMLKEAVTKSNRNIFPVVDEHENFLGIVLLDDIRDLMFNKKLYKKTCVSNYMHAAPEVIYYGIDTMETIMMKFQDSSAWNLPVVKDEKYYGFISKSKLLTVYRRKLIEVTS